MAQPVDQNRGERPLAGGGERIAKLLARAGVASRREIERMIVEGRIARDGVAIDTPATVLPSLAGVTVDGNPVAAAEAARLFLYHKPPGLLVTERDPRGRPTIYDRLPSDLPRLVPVGRLDLATEGLLLLTTDGGLKRQLELPATGVERTYRARVYGPVSQPLLETLIEGIEIDGFRYGPIDANLERRTGANSWIELTLAEGKNREVRRVLEYLGLEVSRLIRTRYGLFVLGDLPPGAVGEVRQGDLVAFRQTLGTVTPLTRRPSDAAPRAEIRVAANTPAVRMRRAQPTHELRPRESREPGAARTRPEDNRRPASTSSRPRPSEQIPSRDTRVSRLGSGHSRGAEESGVAGAEAAEVSTHLSAARGRTPHPPGKDRAQDGLGQAQTEDRSAQAPQAVISAFPIIASDLLCGDALHQDGPIASNTHQNGAALDCVVHLPLASRRPA